MTSEAESIDDLGPQQYLKDAVAKRHRAVADVCRAFSYGHLLRGSTAREMSRFVCVLACQVIDALATDDPELTRGLSRLVDARDALVRAAVFTERIEDVV